MNTYLFVKKSSNAKLGPMPATITDRSSCPGSCPLNNGGGCYAGQGPINWLWKKMAKAVTLEDLCRKIRDLPEGTLWRHNQAGDLPGSGEGIDESFDALVRANAGRRGFTYTHKWYDPANHDTIRRANEAGFTVNLSANSPKNADDLLELGIGPVVTIVPSDAQRCETPKGNRIVICPATRKDGITCSSCGLCQRQNRGVIIGFPAHGATYKKAERLCSPSPGKARLELAKGGA